MDRHRQTDGQALVRIVVRLLWLAVLAEAAGFQPARKRLAVLAVLRHAARAASAYAAHLHAPVRCFLRLPSDPAESEAAQLAAIFRALACAFAIPARRAFVAARLAARPTASPPAGAAAPAGLVPRPRFADTS